jgi:two-component system LytT family response regulator
MNEKIKTAIIDDEETYLFSLIEHLSLYPEIELQAFASKYKQAKKVLENNQLDLVFMDIEMPSKNGFELLNETRLAGNSNFKVVFYTAYDKYLMQALRESAFDYLIKPVKPEELKLVIERYKTQHNLQPKLVTTHSLSQLSEIISLPTPTGIRFLEKNSIVYFECTSDSIFDKKCWQAVLYDQSTLKLRTNTVAKEIIDFVGPAKFMRINPTFIVNINYLSTIEFSTRICQLLPPFNKLNIVVSRSNMAEIREKFDVL